MKPPRVIDTEIATLYSSVGYCDVDISKATYITDEAAGILSRSGGDDLNLDLRGLRSLSENAAHKLCAYSVILDGLTFLPDAVSKELFSGRIQNLSLNGVRRLSDVLIDCIHSSYIGVSLTGLIEITARGVQTLSERNIKINFSALKFLNADTASALAKLDCPLNLDSITDISSPTTSALIPHSHGLSLSGLYCINEDIASILSAYRGNFLRLDGLVEISPVIAKMLAAYAGDLSLNGLAHITDETAMCFSQFTGSLNLNGLNSITPEAIVELSHSSPSISLKGLLHLSDEAACAISKAQAPIQLSAPIISPAAMKLIAFGPLFSLSAFQLDRDIWWECDDDISLLHVKAAQNEPNAIKVLSSLNHDVNSKSRLLYTPLHYACYHGNAECIEVLLSCGADIEVRDLWLSTPLHIAAEYGHVDVINILVKHKANTSARDYFNRTPHMVGCDNEHQDVCNDLIIDDSSAYCSLMQEWDVHDNGPFPIVFDRDRSACTIRAMQECDFGPFRKYVRINSYIKYNFTPLHFAIADNNTGRVIDLLKLAPMLLSLKGEQEIRPSALCSSSDMAAILIKHGVLFSFTDIQIAAARGRTELLRYLLSEGADLSVHEYGSLKKTLHSSADGVAILKSWALQRRSRVTADGKILQVGDLATLSIQTPELIVAAVIADDAKIVLKWVNDQGTFSYAVVNPNILGYVCGPSRRPLSIGEQVCRANSNQPLVISEISTVNGSRLVTCIHFDGNKLITENFDASEIKVTEWQEGCNEGYDTAVDEANHFDDEDWDSLVSPDDNPFYDDNLDMDQQNSRFWDQY